MAEKVAGLGTSSKRLRQMAQRSLALYVADAPKVKANVGFMRKTLTTAGVLALIVLGVLYGCGRIQAKGVADKTDYFMAQHLTAYISAHDLFVPPSWEAFLTWCRKTGHDQVLPPLKELEDFFALPAGRVSVDQRILVTARVRKMKKHADQINSQIDWERLKSKTESNTPSQPIAGKPGSG